MYAEVPFGCERRRGEKYSRVCVSQLVEWTRARFRAFVVQGQFTGRGNDSRAIYSAKSWMHLQEPWLKFISVEEFAVHIAQAQQQLVRSK